MPRIQDNYFLGIINSYLKKLIKSIVLDYEQGSKSIIDITGSSMKPMTPTKKDTNLLSGQIFDSIKGVADEDSKKIRNIIRQGILDRKDTKQIAQDLDDVFKGKNPTKLQYKDRLKMISRTESARLFSNGAYDTAKRLGFTHKYLIGVSDNREGEDSKVALRKYGSEDKAIPINEPFVYMYQGKRREFMFPPDRPNDRSLALYIKK